jgi:hypothetical protein
MPTQLVQSSGALPGNARIPTHQIGTSSLDSKYTATSGNIFFPESKRWFGCQYCSASVI